MQSVNAKTKLLVVSPVAFAPDWQGSRKRVKQMVEVMERFGFEVHFVFVRGKDQRDADSASMSQRLHGRFVELRDRKSTSRLSPWYLQARIASKLRLYRFCNISPDAWYFDEIGQTVKEIVAREGIDVLLVEYPFYSKVLDSTPGVLKIIDMHDVFADRYKEFLRNGKRPVPWYSVSRAGERKSIGRADIVLAIQEDDAAVFRAYGHSGVVTLSYAPAPVEAVEPRQPGMLKVCFLGTGNFFNINALEHYLQHIHPAILRAGIEYELVVIGAVSEPFRQRRVEGNVTMLGKVANLERELSKCDALVNSLSAGTGLPIKVLDSLACGLQVLATPAGARGLPLHRNLGAVRICRETQDWVEAVQTVSRKKREGVDLAADARRDLEIIRRDIEDATQNLFARIAEALPGEATARQAASAGRYEELGNKLPSNV